ncbi:MULTISPECIES: DUF2796 domain-containing protein [Pseudomonas]|uniref:DUF2796 domain-containing protein n=1 Tax=Pseudomonas eucalypticola TaxID=2599595 RepID=A0A7D5H3T0_9PSED|nr:MULTISPECIES: DUF2796 domain-containing protein [Pseudomonas]QKZ06985.1 DUF2796 domain-containing protein [Pseudomonas eucalypticola]
MRRLLLALPFALLPLAIAHADDTTVKHGSLGTHEHGTARVNAALDDQTLALELQTPAMNIVGFEHLATTDADKAAVAKARALLEKPLALFGLPAAAGCSVTSQHLQSPLFGDAMPDDDGDDDHDQHAAGEEHHHSEIHASYALTCTAPDKLKALDTAQLFKTFPATHKVVVQLIGPTGQKGLDATPDNSALSF